MITTSGRIGLATIPWELMGILSRERRDPTEEGKVYWSGPVDYLLRELDCDKGDLNSALIELELDGLVRFELEVQGSMIVEVLKPLMVGRTARKEMP
jgi:hypothetical protein